MGKHCSKLLLSDGKNLYAGFSKKIEMKMIMTSLYMSSASSCCLDDQYDFTFVHILGATFYLESACAIVRYVMLCCRSVSIQSVICMSLSLNLLYSKDILLPTGWW